MLLMLLPPLMRRHADYFSAAIDTALR